MTAKRPTILVVDDEPEVLHSIYDLLRLDYHVVTCERGSDAVNVLATDGEIHVVMSDQRMPGMTGVEVLRHAKRLRPDATRLLITAYADIKAVIDAINQGSIFWYIAKPWNPEELQAVVRQSVEKHNLIVERSRLIAELKEANQRLLDANRLKDAFIEVASHELNTPVAVVLGMTELWRMTAEEKASATERTYIDRIQNAGKRLASTIERMLKLIRTEELDLTLDLQEVALEPALRSAVDDLMPFLQARRQRLEFALHPNLGVAEVDPSKFTDILVNLLGNAIKFTPDGGTITLSAEPIGADTFRVQVMDQGVGIDPNDRHHLFEPFFTGFDTLHHSSGEYQFCKRGIGLGLCLVKTFVELHRGEVEVVSVPGQGSTFGFKLPRRQRMREEMSALAS